MMNWPRHLLAQPAPALGWKKLQTRSKRAAEFLESHTSLRVTAEAATQGEFGWYVPNFADSGSRVSLHASFYFLDELLVQAPDVSIDVVRPEAPADTVAIPTDEGLVVIESGQEFGSKLENKIALGLRNLIAERGLAFRIASKGSPRAADDPADQPASFRLTDYWPYSIPPNSPEDANIEEVYRRMGRGHLIQPDVLIWRPMTKVFGHVQDAGVAFDGYPVMQLVACISGKATIRSDRSQSSRYEGSTISRWRRGRPPHFVVVTAEPSPARLGSLAWGLGEIDCVYHVNVAALYSALMKVDQTSAARGTKKEFASDELRALIDHARVRDISLLFDDIFSEASPP